MLSNLSVFKNMTVREIRALPSKTQLALARFLLSHPKARVKRRADYMIYLAERRRTFASAGVLPPFLLICPFTLVAFYLANASRLPNNARGVVGRHCPCLYSFPRSRRTR
jgi:hypothetical protein